MTLAEKVVKKVGYFTANDIFTFIRDDLNERILSKRVALEMCQHIPEKILGLEAGIEALENYCQELPIVMK